MGHVWINATHPFLRQEYLIPKELVYPREIAMDSFKVEHSQYFYSNQHRVFI